MKIKIIRSPRKWGPGHLILRAWRHPDEAAYSSHDCIELNYFDNPFPTIYSCLPGSEIDDENEIFFESDVSFATFCQVLMNSDYRDGKKYHPITNHSVHAVHFALNCANIQIELKQQPSLQGNALHFLYLQPDSTLAKKLMDALKEYKSEKLIAAGFQTNYENKANELQNLEYEDPDLNQAVFDLLKITNEIKTNAPYQLQTLDRVLDQTLDLVTHPTPEKALDYLTSSTMLQKHHSSRWEKLGESMLIIGSVSLCTAFVSLGLVISAPVAALSFLFAGLCFGISLFAYRKASEEMQTPLSRSMKHVASALYHFEDDLDDSPELAQAYQSKIMKIN